MEHRKIKPRLLSIVFLLAVIILVSLSLNRKSAVLNVEGKILCVPAKKGGIERGINAQGIIIRDETVYMSPACGTLRIAVAERDRVRANTIIAQIIPGEIYGNIQGNKGINLIAERPGIISFTLDRLERILTPSSWMDLDMEATSQIISEPVETMSDMYVDKGQLLYRIVDNYRIYMLVISGFDNIPQTDSFFTVGRKCNLRLNSVSDNIYSAKVVSRVDTNEAGPGSSAVLFELTDFPYELYYLRHVDIKIITEIKKGLLIPKQAVVEDKNGYLVYTPANLGVNPKPIEVIGSDDHQVVCEGLKEGQRVVINPYIIREKGIAVWK